MRHWVQHYRQELPRMSVRSSSYSEKNRCRCRVCGKQIGLEPCIDIVHLPYGVPMHLKCAERMHFLLTEAIKDTRAGKVINKSTW